MNMNVFTPSRGTLPHVPMQPLYPHALPDLYALEVSGDCMAPMYIEGQHLLFSKGDAWKAGDVVALYRRPEAIPLGESPMPLLKRLISAPPACFFNGGHGAVQGKVILRMLNPAKSIIIGTEDILGIHKCLGAMEG